MLDRRYICGSIPISGLAIGDRTGNCCGQLTTFLFLGKASFLTLDISNNYCGAGIEPDSDWSVTDRPLGQFQIPPAVKMK
jgi:hypothetical protein